MNCLNGYFIALSVMATLAIGMTAYFKRRGWIGTPPPPSLRAEDRELPS